MDDKNKLRHSTVILDFEVEMLKENNTGKPVKVTGNGLPQDAMLVRCYVEGAPSTLNTFVMVIHSKEFNEVCSGDEIPEHPDAVMQNVV